MSPITLAELAVLANGRLHGDGTLMVRGANTLRTARPDEIAFAESEKAIRQLTYSSAGAVVVATNMTPPARPSIQVENVREAFARIVGYFRPSRPPVRVGISAAAHISPTAHLADDVDVYPGAFLGDDVRVGRGCTIHPQAVLLAGCQLADDVTVFPGAVLYENTVVGARAIIHAGAVLGAYGFGYETGEGKHRRGAQLGHVEIGADVEIGAGTTIDRGTYGATVVQEGTKIDNQVMIAHNCRIGRHNLLCSQVGIAGSSTTGDYVVMAGQVGVPDHITVGDRAVLGAKSGIMRDVPAEVTMLGIPATLEREQMHKQAAISKLPEMRKQLKALQRAVDELTQAAQRRDAA